MSTPAEDGTFLIVGIGASAGGLAAFTEVLNHLPADTGMAFVLVQHLDPDQESLLGELLDRTTPMTVNTATDGMVVEANQVYVIPSGMQMTIAQGKLHLSPRDRSRATTKTIDRFFQSLASDQKNRAIAIILSGGNDDGSKGIREIRAAGGITFAQARATAEFSDMPGAAIATGEVDFVLSPTEIAEELVNISQHPYLREPRPPQEEQAPTLFQKDELLVVYRLLQRQTGVDFSNYKQTTFGRRLRRRMALNKLSDLTDYIQYLRETPAEIQALYQDALITVTSFFRDAEVYAVLQERVFPTLLQQPSAEQSIRIWVPGCATGEEVYSIAMCLLESLAPTTISPTIQIFGTDISDRAIETARSGIYQVSQMEGVSTERRQRFFTELDSGYQINKSVRETCIFARQDLSSDPPFSDLDLVSCRNVLIYFEPPLQQHVLSVFHYSLKPTGFLMLGNSEGVGDTSELFVVDDSSAKLYTKRSSAARPTFDFTTRYSQETLRLSEQQTFSSSLSHSSVQQWADQILLNRYAPVGVIVNDRLDIIQFRGETSPYLRPPLGEPSFNLLKMLHPNLVVEVRTAIEQARQEEVTVRREGLQSETIQAVSFCLEVIPFNASQGRCFLILFEPTLPSQSDDQAAAGAADSSNALVPIDNQAESSAEIARLRRELTTAHQQLLDAQTYLQMTIADQESTHQQLIAANEEILSSNEELKSTNEELQTAKEEIQSANEELKTTNEELQSRNTESRQANDDLLNLIGNFNIPIVMLSDDLYIRSFTPAARSIFNLIPTDVGRPISNIRSNVDISDLELLVQEVMETLVPTEQEVQTRQGHWYLLRIRPYRTLENQISGAVVALIDIHNLRQTEQELRESQAQLQRELLAVNQMRTLSLQLFSSLDLDQALTDVLDAALATLDTDLGMVQLYDPEQNVLTLSVQRGFRAEVLTHFETVSLDSTSASEPWLSTDGQVFIEDVFADAAFDPYRHIAERAGFRAVLSTPLLSRDGAMLGIISTYFRQSYSPSERELKLLDIYARQASGFIELVHSERERQQIQEQEQAARAENAVKDEFLAVLSHELRTPLNSILGWLQLIEHQNLSEEALDRAIATIKASAHAQLHLIEDLLDVTQMIQDRLQIFPQPTDVIVVLQQAIASVHPKLIEKELQLVEEIETTPELLELDPERIGQAFRNLLTNAIKFTPSGGRITVGLTYLPDQVQLWVSDTGKGIAPDVLCYIFDRFRQADSSKTRREGGLGLGLFLVRSIVEAHGGTIEANSPGANQGSTFTVRLPKVVSQLRPLPSSTASPIAPTLEGIQILLVEDNADNILLFTLMLQQVGAVVSTARSATEALDLMASQSFDLLMSDIGLPDASGYDLIQQVRSLPPEQGGEIPAIAITGYVSEQDIQSAIAAGFQQVVTKPVNLDILIDEASRLMQK